MTDKKDLTRIEDLSEFIHQDDPDVDRALDDESDEGDDDALPSLDDLEDEDQAVLDAHIPFPKGGLDTEVEEETEDFFQTESEDGEGEQEEEQDEEQDESDNASFFSSNFSSNDSDESNDADFTQSDDDPFSLSEPEEETPEESEEMFGAESSDDTFGDGTANFSFDPTEEENLDETSDFELSEPEESPEGEFEIEAPAPVVVKAPRPQPEKFEDVKQFAQNMTYGKIVSGGNPPYSLIVKNIVYEEDAADILALLGEHGLLDASNEATFAQSLKTGALLLSHLSEYSAIFLAHKMRRYRLDIMVGLSEELHPSKSYDSKERGLVRKENLRQNKAETLHLSTTPVSLEQILITTTPTLEGHRIHKYLGMVSEHQSIDSDELERLTIRSLNQESDSENQKEKTKEKIPLSFLEIPAEEEDELIQKYAPGLQQLYHSLAEELRGQALKLGANAIVGVNYQVTPLLETRSNQPQPKYMITCTATAVWVSGLSDLG